MSLQLHLVKACYHLMLPGLARGSADVVRSRARLERISRAPVPADASMQNLTLGGVACTRFRTGTPDPSAIIFYMHGGGHILGSPRTHARLLFQIARRCGLELVASDHRLAPEAPFPAGFDDVSRAYEALLASGRGHGRIILMGDSAGGNFVFALLHALCEQGRPPVAAVALSPWTDLSDIHRPHQGRRERRHVTSIMRRLIAAYAPEHPTDDPRISPIFGQFSGAPPVLIQASSSEPLHHDAVLMAQRLRHFGVPVTVQTWPHAIHVFQALAPFLPEARAAIDQIGHFVRDTLRSPPSRPTSGPTAPSAPTAAHPR
ncbi:alpha/beta hydrolase [Frateuria aurantia]